MAPREWDGKERRVTAGGLEERVRMLEELDRAGSKSRAIMHAQIDDGFKSTADAVNDLGAQLQTFMLSSKGVCPMGDEQECPKKDVPWLEKWLVYLGAGEVAIVAFGVAWIIQHAYTGH